MIDYYLLTNNWKVPKIIILGIVVMYNIIMLEFTALWAWYKISNMMFMKILFIPVFIVVIIYLSKKLK